MSQTPAHVQSSALSPVFLDNRPVYLIDEPRPQVLTILRATGARPSELEISRVRSPAEKGGTHLHLEDVLDRTEDPVKPIYLVSRERRSLLHNNSRVRPPQQMGRIPPPGPEPAADAPLTRAWNDSDPEWKF